MAPLNYRSNLVIIAFAKAINVRLDTIRRMNHTSLIRSHLQSAQIEID